MSWSFQDLLTLCNLILCDNSCSKFHSKVLEIFLAIQFGQKIKVIMGVIYIGTRFPPTVKDKDTSYF